jgi:hypothetical protein
VAGRVVIDIVERRRSTRRLKVVLAALVVVGAIGSLTVSGTYALLTSQEANGGASAASGTLTLGNTVNSGTTCFSYGTGSTSNVNSACTPLSTSSTLQYPGSTATANVQITNNGTVDGSDLVVFMPSCTVTTTTGATVTGGGNPCTEVTDGGNPDGLQLVIEETDSVGTPIACWYPVYVPDGACSTDPSYTDSLPNSFGLFAESAVDLADSVDAGSVRLGHGQTRYFTVKVILPNDASNQLQGEQATFSLTWHITT